MFASVGLIFILKTHSSYSEITNESFFRETTIETIDFLNENQRLYSELFKNYNRDLPAVYTKRNFSTVESLLVKENYPVPRDEIIVALTYAKLLEVDSAKSMMTLIFEYTMLWRDLRLIWNPEEYDNIDHLYVLRKRVWVPEVTPFDSMEVLETRPEFKQYVSIASSGYVTNYVSSVVTANCEMNVTDFPFDSQNCSIKLLSYTFSVSEIEFNSTVLPTIFPAYVGNQEWQVLSVTAVSEIIDEDTNPTQINQFTFEMKRNPSYYVVLIIAPSFILTFICIAGLFTSPLKTDDIDKIAMGLTTMMSSVLMISVLSQSMPKTKEPPKISNYVMVNLIAVSIAIAVAIIVPKIGQLSMIAVYCLKKCFGRIQKARGVSTQEESRVKSCIQRFSWFFKGVLTTAILLCFEGVVVMNLVLLLANENLKESFGAKKK